MAGTAEEHLAKVRENLAIRESLEMTQEGAVGWCITVLFYSALHYVEAYFVSKRGFGCKHHFSRATEIQRDPKISSLYDDYSALETLSREARYDVSSFNAGDLKRADACFRTIEHVIKSIL